MIEFRSRCPDHDTLNQVRANLSQPFSLSLCNVNQISDAVYLEVADAELLSGAWVEGYEAWLVA